MSDSDDKISLKQGTITVGPPSDAQRTAGRLDQKSLAKSIA